MDQESGATVPGQVSGSQDPMPASAEKGDGQAVPLSPDEALQELRNEGFLGPPASTKGVAGSAFSLIGKKLGQYLIKKKIGQGGMGAVYEAHDSSLDRPVALKVLHCGPLDDPKTARRFEREARCLAKLSHPSLLHVYNVGQQDDWHFFAMELLTGTTLSHAIRQAGRMAVRDVLTMASQVLSALEYVHDQGIVHRDIKSSNIMVCGDRYVLMDFGLAKEEKATGLTSVGAVLGTPEYMAPEQAEGNTEGPATDLYSFGVVLYEALAGRVPFKGRSAMAIIKQHWDTEPQPISKLVPDVPRAVCEAIHRCLAKQSKDRFQHSRELAALLSEADAAGERPGVSGLTPPVANGNQIPILSSEDKTLKDSDGVGASKAKFRTRPERSDPVPVMIQPEVRSEARRPWWLFLLLGFLGTTILWVPIWALYLRDQTTPAPARPPEGTPLKVRGTGEQIRLIEFRQSGSDPVDWVYRIERRHKDGTWTQENVNYLEWNERFGDDAVLDFMPPTDRKVKP